MIGHVKIGSSKRIFIQDIADRADVNRGTIYYLHYTDKYDLLER
jgi:hypothetical protein